MSIAAKDDVAVDADALRAEVRSKYREVAIDPHGDLPLPHGTRACRPSRIRR